MGKTITVEIFWGIEVPFNFFTKLMLELGCEPENDLESQSEEEDETEEEEEEEGDEVKKKLNAIHELFDEEEIKKKFGFEIRMIQKTTGARDKTFIVIGEVNDFYSMEYDGDGSGSLGIIDREEKEKVKVFLKKHMKKVPTPKPVCIVRDGGW